MLKFYTDATGNNHPVVRQILKRRTWLVRVDKLKSNPFSSINLFWTQWRKNSISLKVKPHQIYAKIDGNHLITNKASLLETMGYDYKYFPESHNIVTSRDMKDSLENVDSNPQ